MTNLLRLALVLGATVGLFVAAIPANAAELPATGATVCLDPANSQVNCGEDGICPGQDGFYQLGCSLTGRFMVNNDGTVTDNCTGLMWLQQTADVDGDGVFGVDDAPDVDDTLSWCEALNYYEDLVLTTGNGFQLEQDLDDKDPDDAIRFDD